MTDLFQENAHLKEMTEEMLSGDHNPARATPLALEIDSASQEEIAQAYHSIQVQLYILIYVKSKHLLLKTSFCPWPRDF